MNISMKFPDEVTDEIVCQSLRETYARILETLLKNKMGAEYFPVFESDPTEDRKKLEEFLGSLEQVMEWYGA